MEAKKSSHKLREKHKNFSLATKEFQINPRLQLVRAKVEPGPNFRTESGGYFLHKSKEPPRH